MLDLSEVLKESFSNKFHQLIFTNNFSEEEISNIKTLILSSNIDSNYRRHSHKCDLDEFISFILYKVINSGEFIWRVNNKKYKFTFPKPLGGKRDYLKLLKKLKALFISPDLSSMDASSFQKYFKKSKKNSLKQAKLLEKWGLGWRLLPSGYKFTEYFQRYENIKFNLTFLYIVENIIKTLNQSLKKQNIKGHIECYNLSKIKTLEEALLKMEKGEGSVEEFSEIS